MGEAVEAMEKCATIELSRGQDRYLSVALSEFRGFVGGSSLQRGMPVCEEEARTDTVFLRLRFGSEPR